MKSAIARRDADRIPCKWCGQPTRMLATKMCDSCWELETRITSQPDLARRILDSCQTDSSNRLCATHTEMLAAISDEERQRPNPANWCIGCLGYMAGYDASAGEVRLRIRRRWSCSNFVCHEHRWRWTAWLCGLGQRLRKLTHTGK